MTGRPKIRPIKLTDTDVVSMYLSKKCGVDMDKARGAVASARRELVADLNTGKAFEVLAQRMHIPRKDISDFLYSLLEREG